MGLLDKLKGNKKSEGGEATDKKAKRSSSIPRKSLEKPAAETTVPPVPTAGVTSASAAHSDAQAGTVGTKSTDVAAVTKDLEGTHLNHTLDEKNFTSTPFDHDAFFGDRATTTTHESIQKPAVIQEVFKKHVHEIVTPVFHNEHHIVHHQTRIQPVLEQVMLPPKHYVIIDGQKHEILPEAVMNHVVVARDWIPMNVKPQVIVHEYVGNEPLLGPIAGTGASLINKDTMLEHQRRINESHEFKAAGKKHDIPTGNITHVNYEPNQIPISNEPGVGTSHIPTSSVPLATGTKIATVV